MFKMYLKVHVVYYIKDIQTVCVAIFQKLRKREQLLHRLQGLVWGESEMTPQVLDYFLKRLSSNQAANRVLAIRVKVHIFEISTKFSLQ